VLLGVEPTAIERPTTPRAFAVSVLEAAGGGGTLPENYAVEVAPYWLRPHPTLELKDYYNAGFLKAVQQTFSLSLATVRDSTSTRVGIGFRTSPRAGTAPDTVRKLMTKLDGVMDEILTLRQRLRNAKTAADSAAIKTELATARESARPLAVEIASRDNERVGFMVQLAGGAGFNYPQSEFDRGTVDRWGIWGTIAYRLEQPDVHLMAVTRVLRNETEAEPNLFDTGGRVYFQLERLGISAEFVRRTPSEGSGSSNRTVGLLEYRATDDLYVTASFGKDYKQADDDRSPVVAALGLNFHFGTRPQLLVPQ
jgi:hypothetical protein